MTENQLKLNDNKIEAILFPFSSSLKPYTVSLPDSITLGSHNIPFFDSARNLGFILDSKLSMKKHVIKICQTAYFELKRISSIGRFLTEAAAKTLVTSHGLTTPTGTPNSVTQPLQEKKKNCCKTRSLGTPSPPLNTSPGKTALAFHFRTYVACIQSHLHVFQCYKWFWSCLSL